MDGTLIPEKPIPAAVIPLAADLKQAVERIGYLYGGLTVFRRP